MADENDTEPTIVEQKIEEPKEKKSDKKKKNPFLKFLKGLLVTLLGIIFIIAGYLGVNAVIREDIANVVPASYSIHLRTDSVWSAIEPLIDLEATDIVLSEPEFGQYREMILDFRKSKLRQNKFVKIALARRVDFMLYEKDFLAVVDMGWLSGAAKLAPIVSNFIAIKNLSYVKSSGKSYFEYSVGDTIFYIKIYKNFVIVSPSKDLFETSVSLRNGSGFTDAKLKSFKEKLSKPFSITADGRQLLEMFADENPYITLISNALPEDDFATIDFGLTNHNINLDIKIPFLFSELSEIEDAEPVLNLLKHESVVPSILPKLPEPVQYYTLFSVGTLEELKDAFLSVAPNGMDLASAWALGENLSNVVFRESLETLIFSWTGNEYAVLGLENKADPVFVIKISDEEKRKYVFERLFDSIVLKNDTSLLIDNVRLPRIQFPNFIASLLEMFGIKLPSPYYMVKDGYIYFSQSAETLAAMNASMKNGTRLAKNEVWKEISDGISQYSSLSLYYNLERSLPFFIQKNSLLSKVLQLYNVGRMDLQIKSDGFVIQLNAIECEDTSASGIAGFPISLSGTVTSELYKTNKKSGKNVYWLEGDTIKALNSSNLSVSERTLEKIKWIIPASEDTKKGDLWCVTNDGIVYFVDEKLSDVNEPILTGEIPTSNSALYKDGIVFLAKGQRLIYLTQSKVSEYEIDAFDDISSTPVILNNKAIVYEKSFMGGIHIIDLENPNSENDFIETNGIGFGSPAVISTKKDEYIGFVNQAGIFSLWRKEGENFILYNSVDLDGIFYSNVISFGDSFVALSADGTLNKISLDCDVTKVKIPYLTAKKSYITIDDYNNDKFDEIFVCGDANSIYGFSDSLELLSGFPIYGYGIPVFFDLNGNKKNDCIVISLDNKLNGWKVN